jgi:hypothetical protein
MLGPYSDDMLNTWKRLGPLSLEIIGQNTGKKLDFNNNINYRFVEITYPHGYYYGLVNSHTKKEEGVGQKVISYEIYEGELSNE